MNTNGLFGFGPRGAVAPDLGQGQSPDGYEIRIRLAAGP